VTFTFARVEGGSKFDQYLRPHAAMGLQSDRADRRLHGPAQEELNRETFEKHRRSAAASNFNSMRHTFLTAQGSALTGYRRAIEAKRFCWPNSLLERWVTSRSATRSRLSALRVDWVAQGRARAAAMASATRT
jgi:hypothetical protein